MGLNMQSKDVGETVASYAEYEAAQKAVSKLIEAEIPAREISIVWADLRLVESVTGRLGYGRAAWSGALNGAMLGLLFGAVYTLLSPEASLQLLLGFMLVGTALGMVMRLLSYRMVRGRRDYSSATRPVADHYEIAVQSAHAGKARGVLGQQRVAPTQPVRPSGPLPPPQYGVRIDPATGRPVTPQAAPAAPPAPSPEADSAAAPAAPASTEPDDQAAPAESAPAAPPASAPPLPERPAAEAAADAPAQAEGDVEVERPAESEPRDGA